MTTVRSRALHPAHGLACWLLAAVAVQTLSGTLLAGALLLAAMAGGGVRGRWWRLIRRTRWLLVSLFVVLAWGVAGDPVVVDGGVLVPTVEGIAAGAVQAGRLLLVLAVVAALLETMPMAGVMAGAYVLLRPLARFGLEADRAVVRLALTLRYAADAPAGEWRRLLHRGWPGGAQAFAAADPECAETGTPDESAVEFSLPPARARDWLTLIFVALLTSAAVLA